jgi:hypothetical protein
MKLLSISTFSGSVIWSIFTLRGGENLAHDAATTKRTRVCWQIIQQGEKRQRVGNPSARPPAEVDQLSKVENELRETRTLPAPGEARR